MKRLGIALSAGLLFAVASQAAPAAAQLELLDGVSDGVTDGVTDVVNPPGGGDPLSGLLDSVSPPDTTDPVPDPVDDPLKPVTDLLPGDTEPTPDPDPDPVDPGSKGGGQNEDDGVTPKPRTTGGDPPASPAPAPAVEDTQSITSVAGPARSGGAEFAAARDAVVAGTTVVSDALDLRPRPAEAETAASVPLPDTGSPLGPVQFLAVLMVAAVMCAEFLYGVRRSTGQVLRA